MCLLAGPAAAQSEAETLVRFVGFLGDLRLTVEDVRAQIYETDDDPRVAIVMEETAAAEFQQFTRVHVNQSVTFFVCGEQMESITVQAPIDTGFALSDRMSERRAERIVAAMNGEGECP